MSDALAAHATTTIEAGSQSFAAAARLFDGRTRRSAIMLYAWCRHCDDEVDGQILGHEQVQGDRAAAADRLVRLEDLTRRAYSGGKLSDPAFAALQEVVRRHDIPLLLPLEHLAGFRMDAEGRRYATIEDTLDYCYHVAGVVGIMMAMIMGVRDEAVLQRAADLGIAFQLTNIARDLVEDARIGRVYLPQAWLDAAGIPAAGIAAPEHRTALAGLAGRLLGIADLHYDSALGGIAALPLRSAWAIAAARGIYRQIGRNLLARGPEAWDRRTATSKLEKLRHVAAGGALALGSRSHRPPTPRPADLWQHPR